MNISQMTSTEMDRKKYVHAKHFLKEYGVCRSSLMRYADSGFIRYIRTPGNVRLYHIDDGPKLSFIRQKDKSKDISLNEKELIYIYKNDTTHSTAICYSRVRDESKKEKLIYEKKLFEKFIMHENREIIQEYGKRDDLRRPELKKIMDRCKNKEIKYIFVTSFNSLANDVFLLVQTLLEIYKIELYILKDDGVIINSPDSKEDEGSVLRLIELQRQRLLN